MTNEKERNQKKERTIGLNLKAGFIITIIIVLVFSLLVMIVVSSVDKLVYKTEKEKIIQDASLFKQSIDFELKTLQDRIYSYSNDYRIQNAVKSDNFSAVNDVIKLIIDSDAAIENVFLTDREGKIVASGLDNVGISVAEYDFFKDCAQGKTDKYLDSYPYNSPTSKHPVIVFASPVRTGDGVYGVLSLSFDLLKYSDSVLLNKKFGNDGYAFIGDDMGRLVAHPEQELLLTDISQYEFTQQILSSDRKSDFINYDWDGRKKYLAFDYLDQVPWYIAVSIYHDDLVFISKHIQKLIIIVSLISLVFITMVEIFIISRLIISRIHRIRADMKKASEGDLTGRTIDKTTDELALINNSFNILQDSFVTFLANLVISMNKTNVTGQELASNITETASAVNQINANIEHTRNQINDQVANTTETAAIIEQMTHNIESLDGSIKEQSVSIENSSSAIEEMIAGIQSLSKNTSETESEVLRMNSSAEKGRSLMENVLILVKAISAESDQLLEANTLISGISSQTNLLSMNAAIEAAHAGDAGKGFSVVADEIRKLAESSGIQSKGVNQNLKRIKKSIDEVVEASEATNSEFSEIIDAMGGVSRGFLETKGAMEEQSAGSQQIMSALTDMQNYSTIVRDGSKEMKEGNKQILITITNLNEISQRTGNAVEEISIGINEINNAIMEIDNLSLRNTENQKEVEAEASKFKII